MIRFSTIADLEGVQGPLHLAMGVFDGVHLGHQAVIGAAVEGARGSGGVAGVLTFEPHPIQVLAPERAPRRILLSLEHKERLLASLGVTVLLALRFDETMACQPAEEFADRLFSVGALGQAVAGADWKFGRERRGTMGVVAGPGRAPRGRGDSCAGGHVEGGTNQQHPLASGIARGGSCKQLLKCWDDPTR